MRKASYEFGPVQGDEQPATVAVFYFGPGECRYWGDRAWSDTVEFINSKNNFMALADELGVHQATAAVLVAIISFMYRYLFVLVDEAGRLLRARAARSAQPADVESAVQRFEEAPDTTGIVLVQSWLSRFSD